MTTTTLPFRPRVLVLTGGDLIRAGASVLDGAAEYADLVLASTQADIDREIATADVVFVWDFRFAKFDELLPRAHRLAWIHVAAVGVDAILTPALRASDIVVTNSRGVFEEAMAEYTLGLYLAHLKDLRTTILLQQRHRWEHRFSQRLRGRSAAILGTGAIGRQVAATLSANGVNVQLVGRRAVHDDVYGDVAESSRLAEVAARADLLVLAAPLTDNTYGIVDDKVLSALQPHAYLINIGRGALIDEAALERTLEQGGFAGAALDVLVSEPLAESSSLWDNPRLMISPHMSADFEGFDTALAEIFIDNLGRWANAAPLNGVVDKVLGYVPSGAK